MGAAKRMVKAMASAGRRRNRRRKIQQPQAVATELHRMVKDHPILTDLQRQVQQYTFAECDKDPNYINPTPESKWLTDWFFFVHQPTCLAYPSDIMNGYEGLLHVCGRPLWNKQKTMQFCIIRRQKNQLTVGNGEVIYLQTPLLAP